MPTHLDVDLTWRDGTAVLTLRGAVDLFTAPLLGEQVAEAIACEATGVVLDLTDLRFIDSSGRRVLIDAHEALPGNVSTSGASGLVLRVLEVASTAPALSVDDRGPARVLAPAGSHLNQGASWAESGRSPSAGASGCGASVAPPPSAPSAG